MFAQYVCERTLKVTALSTPYRNLSDAVLFSYCFGCDENGSESSACLSAFKSKIHLPFGYANHKKYFFYYRYLIFTMKKAVSVSLKLQSFYYKTKHLNISPRHVDGKYRVTIDFSSNI